MTCLVIGYGKIMQTVIVDIDVSQFVLRRTVAYLTLEAVRMV